MKRSWLVKDRKEGNRRFHWVTNPAIFRLIDAVDIKFMDALLKMLLNK